MNKREGKGKNRGNANRNPFRDVKRRDWIPDSKGLEGTKRDSKMGDGVWDGV